MLEAGGIDSITKQFVFLSIPQVGFLLKHGFYSSFKVCSYYSRKDNIEFYSAPSGLLTASNGAIAAFCALLM